MIGCVGRKKLSPLPVPCQFLGTVAISAPQAWQVQVVTSLTNALASSQPHPRGAASAFTVQTESLSQSHTALLQKCQDWSSGHRAIITPPPPSPP